LAANRKVGGRLASLLTSVHFPIRRLDVAAEAIRVKERLCGTIGDQPVAEARELGRRLGKPDGQRLVILARVRDEFWQSNRLE